MIRAFEGGFVPTQVRIPAGSEVTFRLLSEDLPHGFTIEKAGLQVELVQSKFVEAMHTFAEPGEYEFLARGCSSRLHGGGAMDRSW